MSEIIKFGKHKGKPVDALLDDRPYMEWLLAQPWAKEKLGNVYNIVINNGAEPSETPEHNAMQIKFLDEEYRLKFAIAAVDSSFFATATTEAYERLKICVNDAIAKLVEKRAMNLKTYGHIKAIPLEPLPDIVVRGCGRNRPFSCELPTFESNGVDVEFSLYVGFQTDFDGFATGSPYESSNYVSIPKAVRRKAIRVEIKPTIGDDYPAVLRQVKRSGAMFLLVDSYTGTGANIAQFREFFSTQGVKVVFADEVEAVRLEATE